MLPQGGERRDPFVVPGLWFAPCAMPAAWPRQEATFLDCEEPVAEEPTLAEAVEKLFRQASTQHWERFLRRALRLDHRRKCWGQLGQWLQAIRCRGRGHDHHLLR